MTSWTDLLLTVERGVDVAAVEGIEATQDPLLDIHPGERFSGRPELVVRRHVRHRVPRVGHAPVEQVHRAQHWSDVSGNRLEVS